MYLGRSPSLSRGSVSDADSREHRARSGQGWGELWQEERQKREGRGPRSRSGLEISDTSVGGFFTVALPTFQLKKGKERGGRGSLGPGAGVLGAGRCWGGGLDGERRPGCGTEAARVSATAADAAGIQLRENRLYV